MNQQISCPQKHELSGVASASDPNLPKRALRPLPYSGLDTLFVEGCGKGRVVGQS